MSDPAERFRTALDLHDAGVQMMRLKFRRMYPEESDAEIQARVREWLTGGTLEIPGHRSVSRPRS